MRSGWAGQVLRRVRGGWSRRGLPRWSAGRVGSRSNPSSRSSSQIPVRFSGVAVAASAWVISVIEWPAWRSRSTWSRAACLAGATRGPGRRSMKKPRSPARKSRTMACTLASA